MRCRDSVSLNIPFRFLAGTALALLLHNAPLRADEFATIPAGDPIYSQIAALAQRSVPVERTSSKFTLTRYEAAIETARALMKIKRANAQNSPELGKSALRALRGLTIALRPELLRLEVDVIGAQRLLDELLLPATAVSDGKELPVAPVSLRTSGLRSLAQRLRVDSALSAVARDSADPFGDSNTRIGLLTPNSSFTGPAAANAIAGKASGNFASGTLETRAALGLTDWMELRARYAATRVAPGGSPWNLGHQPAETREVRSLGAGVGFAVRPGVTLTGDLASETSFNALGSATSRGTRIGTGLGLSAWQNRLSLNSNLSRLLPGDSQALSTYNYELQFGVGVTEWLKLSLQYQSMFSPRSPVYDRALSGGISVKF